MILSQVSIELAPILEAENLPAVFIRAFPNSVENISSQRVDFSFESGHFTRSPHRGGKRRHVGPRPDESLDRRTLKR